MLDSFISIYGYADVCHFSIHTIRAVALDQSSQNSIVDGSDGSQLPNSHHKPTHTQHHIQPALIVAVSRRYHCTKPNAYPNDIIHCAQIHKLGHIEWSAKCELANCFQTKNNLDGMCDTRWAYRLSEWRWSIMEWPRGVDGLTRQIVRQAWTFQTVADWDESLPINWFPRRRPSVDDSHIGMCHRSAGWRHHGLWNNSLMAFARMQHGKAA